MQHLLGLEKAVTTALHNFSLASALSNLQVVAQTIVLRGLRNIYLELRWSQICGYQGKGLAKLPYLTGRDATGALTSPLSKSSDRPVRSHAAGRQSTRHRSIGVRHHYVGSFGVFRPATPSDPMPGKPILRYWHPCVIALVQSALLLPGTQIRCAAASNTPVPAQIIDAIKLGFTPFPSIPNSEFVHDPLGKLATSDSDTEVLMISEKIAVIYSNRPSDGIPGHTADRLKALFIDTETGALLRKQEWPTITRLHSSERFDSEAHIIALSGARYLVDAQHTLFLYSADGTLLRTKALAEGMWAAKSVSGGDDIFLRRAAGLHSSSVQYFCLDSQTLKERDTFVDTDAIRIQFPFSGAARSVIYAQRDGLEEVFPHQLDRLICTLPMCTFPRDSGANWDLLGQPPSQCLLFVSDEGLLIADIPNGLAWSRLTSFPGTGAVRLYLTLLDVSLAGNRFTLLLAGDKHQAFDGESLTGKWEYFIYNIATKQRVFITPQISFNGDTREAFSRPARGSSPSMESISACTTFPNRAPFLRKRRDVFCFVAAEVAGRWSAG